MAHGHNVVLELDFGAGAKGAKGGSKAKGKASRYAVVKQIQVNPTNRRVLHVDLHEVDLSEEIEVAVVIEPVGDAIGVKDGGVMDWERREVNVKALPSALPEALELDVSELRVGQHLAVNALKAPKGVTILDDPESILVAMLPPRVEHVEVEAEEVAEPEVVGTQTSEE
jgi:large subunit ribosomal protein L25